jgi:hypothetical protein
MKDNYGDVGKTYTASSSLLDQERNPLIGARTYTVLPTTVVTVPPTTLKTTPVTTVPPTPVTTTPEQIPVLTTTAALLTTIPATAALTKSPGFESVFAMGALLLALMFIARKE